ncbi:MAG: hypothetical protein LAO07_05685 [Acidobacteriia bacterium]|nr:hypothetical protein [Terriglobia bacterium]
MKKRLLLWVGVSAALMLAASLIFAQSLGDLARAERAKREKEGKKPVKVITNDNLPPRPPGEGLTAASSMSAMPPAEEVSPTPPEPASPATEAAGGDKEKTPEYWQEQFKSLRKTLTDDEEQQRLAEDELSLLQLQQARELSPDVQGQLEAQVKSKTAEVEAKREETAKTRKDMDDLEKEFKDSGAPADWSKTD